MWPKYLKVDMKTKLTSFNIKLLKVRDTILDLQQFYERIVYVLYYTVLYHIM